MLGYRRIAVCVATFAMTLAVPVARADEPSAVALPSRLGLDEAVRLARTRGLDVLIAELQAHAAEGDVSLAGAVPNPALTLGYGRAFSYAPQLPGQDSNQYLVAVSDQAATFDSLSGKRSLRLAVTRSALAAARLARDDATRTLEFQVKQQYAAVAEAVALLGFSQEVAGAAQQSLALNRHRYPQVIDEGALARIETQKLEADQALDQAILTLRAARAALAFLLGVRAEVPAFEVDGHALDYHVPPSLADATEPALLRLALGHRPDLRQSDYERSRALSALELAKRQRFPDVTLSAQYTQTGTGQNAIQPPTVSFAVTAPIPVFYQQQGEVRRAEAEYDTQGLLQAKVTAKIVFDVETSFAAFTGARQLVERMRQGLLASAQRARDVTDIQFKAGAGTLIEFLDAHRTYVASNVEYLQDLTTYWTAVFQLEQAVGMNLQ
jgi:cobalt-zinc-cadmium efflux system outer membrane protein